jgi:hypothetical protein
MISRSNSTALSGQVLDRSVEIIASRARHRTSPSEGGHAGLQAQGAAPFKPPLSPSFHFPSTHWVNFAPANLYRGAGFDIVWCSFATVAAIGFVFFTAALVRFRRTAR